MLKLLTAAGSGKVYTRLFLINFFCWVCYVLFFSPYTALYGDASNYFNTLGKSFETNGNFSLLHFKDSIRGVIFPLFNYLLIKLSEFAGISPLKIWKIVSAGYFAMLSNVLMPVFAERFFKIRPKVWQVLLLDTFLFLFWRGYVDFPLTDFLSLIFILAAIYFKESDNRVSWFLSGLMLTFAINLRPIYTIAILPFGFWLLYYLWQKRNFARQGILSVCFLLAGFFLGSFPQVYINYHQYGRITPFVQTTIGSQQGSLYLMQLKWGMSVQKYETNVGHDYPAMPVIYWDTEGNSLYKQEQGDSVQNYTDYLRLLVRHPLVFSSIYCRHIFNGMDIVYPTPYIPNMKARSWLLRLFNYSLIFLFLMAVILAYLKRRLSIPQWLIISMLTAPCLFTIPTAMEVRFLLPFHLMVYSVFLFFSDYEIVFSGLRKRSIYILVTLYMAFILACFACSSATLAHIEYPLV
ncbi:MAG: hypothetical protein ACJ75J_07600 [Cytophagaceae bacterium]